MPPKTKPESSHLSEENAGQYKKKKGLHPTETAHKKPPVSPAKLKAALKQDTGSIPEAADKK